MHASSKALAFSNRDNEQLALTGVVRKEGNSPFGTTGGRGGPSACRRGEATRVLNKKGGGVLRWLMRGKSSIGIIGGRLVYNSRWQNSLERVE